MAMTDSNEVGKDGIKPGFRKPGEDVSSFRAESRARAKKNGYSKATKGEVDTFTKGTRVIVVTHSAKHYVQTVTVNGEPVILPGEKDKHKRLQPLFLA